jgi:hypothetical protein
LSDGDESHARLLNHALNSLREGQIIVIAGPLPVRCLLRGIAVATTTTGAGHDVFLQRIEIAKINGFDLQVQVFKTELH